MANDAVLERQQRNTLSGRVSRALSGLKDWKTSLRSLSTMNSLTIIALQVVVFSILCLLYLAFSNKYITQGYVVNRLEAEREQLIVKNEVANRRLEESKSLSQIRERADREMVYAFNPIYVEFKDTQVALAY